MGVVSDFIEFGLFGPGLTYHTNKHDKHRLVISLIFCKIYIGLPFDCHRNDIENYSVYGFYFDDDPDKLTLCWKNYRKVITMPWVDVVLQRYLLDRSGLGSGNGHMSIELCKAVAMTAPTRFFRTTSNAYLPEIRYYVTAVFCKAKMFKNWEVMPYKPAYDVTIIFDKPYYGYTELTFSTKTDVALNEQIAVQLLAVQMNYDKNYKDF